MTITKDVTTVVCKNLTNTKNQHHTSQTFRYGVKNVIVSQQWGKARAGTRLTMFHFRKSFLFGKTINYSRHILIWYRPTTYQLLTTFMIPSPPVYSFFLIKYIKFQSQFESFFELKATDKTISPKGTLLYNTESV